MALLVMRLFILHLRTKSEVRRPSNSLSALVELVTLIFDLETGTHYARGVGDLPTKFGVSFSTYRPVRRIT